MFNFMVKYLSSSCKREIRGKKIMVRETENNGGSWKIMVRESENYREMLVSIIALSLMVTLHANGTH